MEERTILFGAAETLVGVLTQPHRHGCQWRLPAIIILNAGFIHRVGPNRIHVTLARDVASLGLYALRFDFAGIGDSESRDDNMPFEASSICETQQAMDYLESAYGIHDFILAGVCSGADAALRTACHDRRVVGVIAINGMFMDSIQSQCLKEHLENGIRRRYYRKYLFTPGRWWKLLTGRTSFRNAAGLVTSRIRGLWYQRVTARPQTDLSTACRWALDRGIRLLLIYSEGSSAWDAYHLTLEAGLGPWRTSGRLRVETIKDADHVCTLLWSQRVLVDLVHQWVRGSWPEEPVIDSLPEHTETPLPAAEQNGRVCT